MKQASKWSVRQMKCPEGKGQTGLLLEWKGEKGRKILRSASCDNAQLAEYSGIDCRWGCLEIISGKKKLGVLPPKKNSPSHRWARPSPSISLEEFPS
jgi:hypothetical protein